MKLIAHRGLSQDFPDNTKESFLAAIKAGFDMIELDIQLSKDNQIFIYHDTNINNRLLKTLLFSEIQKRNSSILLLKDFFTLVLQSNTEVYLDIKGNEIDICYPLHCLLQGMNLSRIYIASFNIHIIESLYSLSPYYQLGIISENKFPISMLSLLIETFQLSFFSFHWTMLDHTCLNFLKEKKVSVFTYTLKNNDIRQFMMEYNVDGIVSNYMIKN
jgi:glycerophosphoryl diester phosphodiesterase